MLSRLLAFLGFNSKQEEKFVLFDPDNGDNIAVYNSHIRYKTKLIENFKAEHKILLKYYTMVLEELGKHEYKSAEIKLANFIEQLEHHIHSENELLYIFLKEIYKDSKEDVDYIVNMQKKMRVIFITVGNTLKKYPAIDQFNISELEADLNELATILIERIANEENKLYAMYKLKEM